MIFIKLIYKEVNEDIYNVEKAFIYLDDSSVIMGISEITETHTKFTFILNEKNMYTIQTVNNSNFENYWVESLYLNNEKVDHCLYEIIYEDSDEQSSIEYEEDDDSCG